jgi:hypothetical protein
MIWIFTCSTIGCENNTNPANLCDAVNPVLCSLCYVLTDAVETDEPCTIPNEIVEKTTAKAKK